MDFQQLIEKISTFFSAFTFLQIVIMIVSLFLLISAIKMLIKKNVKRGIFILISTFFYGPLFYYTFGGNVIMNGYFLVGAILFAQILIFLTGKLVQKDTAKETWQTMGSQWFFLIPALLIGAMLDAIVSTETGKNFPISGEIALQFFVLVIFAGYQYYMTYSAYAFYCPPGSEPGSSSGGGGTVVSNPDDCGAYGYPAELGANYNPVDGSGV